MRYAILADIHSNLAAFQAVLQHLEQSGGAEELWCLGDIVGYGPEPEECLALLHQHRHLCVAGNHDWAAIGLVDISDFNPEAAAACLWTGKQLGAKAVAYLKGLSLRLERDDFTLVHGSPRYPIWEYLLSEDAATENLSYFQSRYCLVGHSHVPLLFEEAPKGRCRLRPLPAELILAQSRLILNPGGVGQPRDGNPLASYALYDSEQKKVWLFRVSYDIEATQKKMLALGLPRRLALRLSYGR